jgi:hypothetical protein
MLEENIFDAIEGLLIGILATFVLLFSFQTHVPYPLIMVKTIEHPWIIALMYILAIIIGRVSPKLSVLLILLLTAFVMEIFLFTRPVIDTISNVELIPMYEEVSYINDTNDANNTNDTNDTNDSEINNNGAPITIEKSPIKMLTHLMKMEEDIDNKLNYVSPGKSVPSPVEILSTQSVSQTKANDNFIQEHKGYPLHDVLLPVPLYPLFDNNITV